ncbi:MAG: TIGR04211 family SH3 domain-containing protein [Nitrosomonas sp.]|nr:TIGR04211 family SH3 domain-containing protein [Nitrosomonas sp.]
MTINKELSLYQLVLIFLLLALTLTARAEKRYASDQVEVLLRTGPSQQHAIVRMLKSGDGVEVLEHDKAKGYSRVKSKSGSEGWVLSRHLMKEQSARELLENLSLQLSGAEGRVDGPGAQASLIKLEFETLSKQVVAVEKDNQLLQEELANIKQTAANAIALESQHQEIQQQNTVMGAKLAELEQENATLTSHIQRDWFYAGAIVLFSGLLLGLLIPRIQWRKRSRFSDF